MLFIFRQLRRSFFQPGKLRTYVAYAIGEILLIVVGILIAVQIGEWNQSRHDFAEETSILQKLKSEFEQNQGRLKQNREMYGAISEDLRAFLEVIGPDPEVVPDELVHRYMSSLYVIPGYQPNTGTINSLIGSGTISLIANEALNYNLNSWPAAIEALPLRTRYHGRPVDA